MIELAVSVLLGCAGGVVAGLVPGIHVNLVSLAAASFAPQYFSHFSVACFIVSMAVVQSFLNIIPAVYLGAPDSDSCLGVLPGHRFLLKGLGLLAVKLNVLGSLFGLFLSVLFLPFAVFIVKNFYSLIAGLIGWLVLAVVLFMVWRDRRPFWALFVFSLSGVLGFVVLNTPGLRNPLFPLLSGIFGVSVLVFSSGAGIPPQKAVKAVKLDWLDTLKAVFSSFVAGFIASALPGLGSSQAVVLAKQFAGRLSEKGFMVLLGGVNTVNFALSIASLYALGKARNGAVAVVGQLLGSITVFQVFAFAGVALISGAVAVVLALFFGRVFSRIVEAVNYRVLVLAVVALIVLLVLLLSGWLGLIILFASASLGVVVSVVKCSRSQAMGCLLVPVMAYFLF